MELNRINIYYLMKNPIISIANTGKMVTDAIASATKATNCPIVSSSSLLLLVSSMPVDSLPLLGSCNNCMVLL